MPSFTIEVDFDVYCARCGAGLCNQSSAFDATRNKGCRVDVEPCERCLDDAKDAGINEGYDTAVEGFERAKEEA